MAVLQWNFPPLLEALSVKKPSPHQIQFKFRNPSPSIAQKPTTISRIRGSNALSSRCRCQTQTPAFYPQSSDDESYEDEEDDEDDGMEDHLSETTSPNGRTSSPPPLLRKKKRYRKAYPGESKGITEEMRFVAMKLRNTKSARSFRDDSNTHSNSDSDSSPEEKDSENENDSESNVNEPTSESVPGSWQPSMEGFVKHLVDCKLVFETLERIVEESDDVAYAYFRKTGLERSEGLAKDIEGLRGRGVEIPEPSNPGVSYAKYLEELSKESAPLFLTHLYNVYLSHVAGGQVIVKQVSEKILDGRELEFCRWDGNPQEQLKDVKDKINRLGEHWSRSNKNKCLSEASKAFKYMGQIVRLIIL